MKPITIFALSFFLVNLCYAQELRVWQEDLYYKNGNKFILVKRDIGKNLLRGYAVVDENTLFLAYQPEKQAEASTIISLFNVQNGKEQKLDDIGGTGESFFDYNRETGQVVFSLWEGIYVFKLSGYKPGNYKKVVNVENCYEVFWVDASTIGYTDQRENKKKLVKIEAASK